jgi:hypothetical protein
MSTFVDAFELVLPTKVDLPFARLSSAKPKALTTEEHREIATAVSFSLRL